MVGVGKSTNTIEADEPLRWTVKRDSNQLHRAELGAYKMERLLNLLQMNEIHMYICWVYI